MQKLSLIILLLTITFPLYCQEKWDTPREKLENRGEVYTAILINELEGIDNPFLLPGFDQIREDSVFLYLSKKDTFFLKNNIKLLHFPQEPSRRNRVSMTDDLHEVLNGEAYPTYPLYLKMMEYFRDSFPDDCTIDTIGYSIENRLILAARISPERNKIAELPVGFYSSTMHGDETAGYVFMLMLIHHFLVSDDPLSREILEKMIVVINPLANPDGTYFTSDSTVYGSTRGNAAGIDLNRNFPDPEGGMHPDGYDWQPETKAMMDYMQKISPSISANFHGGTEVVNYPFDTWIYKHADDDWFRFISQEYADSARLRMESYMDDFNHGITNGYQWYQVKGGRQDYVTYFLRGRETTIELSETKLLPESQLSEFWKANKSSMLKYLKQGIYGIHGRIVDSLTNESLYAEIRIPEHDKLNSSVFSKPETGKFFRYIKEGYYDIEIKSSGYRLKRLAGISVNDYENKYVTIKLIPDYILPVGDEIKVGPNPFKQEITVFLEMTGPDFVFFKLYDVYGKVLLHEFRHFQGGYSEHVLNPGIAPGAYLLTVSFGKVEKKFRLIKLQ